MTLITFVSLTVMLKLIVKYDSKTYDIISTKIIYLLMEILKVYNIMWYFVVSDQTIEESYIFLLFKQILSMQRKVLICCIFCLLCSQDKTAERI